MNKLKQIVSFTVLATTLATSIGAQQPSTPTPSHSDIKREAQLQKKAAEAKEKWAKAEEKVKKLEQELTKAKQEANRARQEADKAQQQRDAVRMPAATQ